MAIQVAVPSLGLQDQQGDEQILCRGFHTTKSGDTSGKNPLPLLSCSIILVMSRTVKNLEKGPTRMVQESKILVL